MNKKSIAGLLLFGCLVMSILIYGGFMLTGGLNGADAYQSRDTKITGTDVAANDQGAEQSLNQPAISDSAADSETAANSTDSEALNTGGQGADSSSDMPREKEEVDPEQAPNPENTEAEDAAEPVDQVLASAIECGAVLDKGVCPLIVDSSQIDYKAYLPEVLATNSALEEALSIDNPKLNIQAQAAILFNADTMEVLYHKNPVEAVFPASTAKLLTCLVVLDWCGLEEKVPISNEIRLIARDSTTAGLYPGQVVTIRNLLEGMLLPSGNDAAYAAATYVGRKSLQREGARREDAVAEFVRLMNDKAKRLGVLNSCFKTPDGYDAIGQYTTAYDMGLIGLAAMKNEVILEISKKGSSHNRFISGDQVTWTNTNALVRKDSGRYYSSCIGGKTGTSTMAGRCLVAAGKAQGKTVLCVIMNSTQTGRWTDAKTLLDYGLY